MKAKKELSLEHYLIEVEKNIKDDRAIAGTLLTDLVKFVKSHGELAHESYGLIIAKYLEAMQRSNEQLVKLSALVQKKEASDSSALGEGEIYDLIKRDQDE